MPGADPDLLSVLVSGTLLAFVLTMRGETVLHASAVQVGDAALAFVGASGMGKSTMATLLCADGARLVTDDVLRLDTTSSPPTCALGATELRLRKGADHLAERFADRGSAPGLRTTGDARQALAAVPATTEDLPLAALVVPVPDHSPERRTTEITRLSPKEAMVVLSQFPRLLGWQDAAVRRASFHQLADVVDRVPVHVAVLPWGPPFPEDIASGRAPRDRPDRDRVCRRRRRGLSPGAQRVALAVPATASTAENQACDVVAPGRRPAARRAAAGRARFTRPEHGVLQRPGGGGDRARPRGTCHQSRPRGFTCVRPAWATRGRPRTPGSRSARERPSRRSRFRGTGVPRTRRARASTEADLRARTPGPGPAGDPVPVLDPTRRLVDVEQVDQANGARERGVVAQVDQRVGGVESAGLDRPDREGRAAREDVGGRDVEPAAQGLGEHERPVQVDDRAAGAAELDLAGHLSVEEVVAAWPGPASPRPAGVHRLSRRSVGRDEDVEVAVRPQAGDGVERLGQDRSLDGHPGKVRQGAADRRERRGDPHVVHERAGPGPHGGAPRGRV